MGALCVAHALVARQEANLLAVVHSTGIPEGVGAASVLSEWFGHSSLVRLGAYKGVFGMDASGRMITGSYGVCSHK